MKESCDGGALMVISGMTVEPIGRRYGLREETKDLRKGREGEGEEQAANERQAGGEVGRPWALTNRPSYRRLLDATTRRFGRFENIGGDLNENHNGNRC